MISGVERLLVLLCLSACGGRITADAATDADAGAAPPADATSPVDAARESAETADAAVEVAAPDAGAECKFLLDSVDLATACTPTSVTACTGDLGPAFGNALFACVLQQCALRVGYAECMDLSVTFAATGCWSGSGGGTHHSQGSVYLAWDKCVSAAFEGPHWSCAANGQVQFVGCLGK